MATRRHPEEWTWGDILDRARRMHAAWKASEDDPQVKSWIESRPPEIRALIDSHPSCDIYRVVDKAPYRLTRPGSVGVIMAYTETDDGAMIRFGMLRGSEDAKEYMPIHTLLEPKHLERVPLTELEEKARLETN